MSDDVRRSSRASKAPETFTYVARKKAAIETDGDGVTLSSIPAIVEKLKNTTSRDPALKQIHTLMYSRVGSQKNVKDNIAKFNGFAADAADQPRLVQKMQRYSLANLKSIFDILCLNRSSTSFEDGKTPNKDALIERLADWLIKPSAELTVETKGKKTRKVRKTPAKSPSKRKASTATSTKKKQKPSAPEPEPEPEESSETTLLRKAVQDAVKNTDLQEMNLREMRKQVAEETGIDLSTRKAEFKTIVAEVLQSM